MENEIPQPDEQIEYSFSQYYVGKRIKKIKLKCIECKNKFEIPRLIGSSDDRSVPAFCFQCGNKRCTRCGITLSRKYKCKNKICKNRYHGMPSKEMPDLFCVECMIYVKG